MQNSVASSCKLPLLDGEGDSAVRLIAAPVELDQIEKIQQIWEKERAEFTALLCTAWGLLLRCYIGQEKIAFYFSDASNGRNNHQSASSQEAIFGMDFLDQEDLSTLLMKAKSGFHASQQAGTLQLNTAVQVLPKSREASARDDDNQVSLALAL